MSLEMAAFARSRTSSYSSSVVTMAISCIMFEIKDNWLKIAIFSYIFFIAILGKTVRNIFARFFHNRSDPWPIGDVIGLAAKNVLFTRNERFTDRRTKDRRKSDLNSRAFTA